jgi:hypothetical protein
MHAARPEIEKQVGSHDGAGSGFGLTSCLSCGRIIDRTCSVCPPPASSAPPVTPENALKRQGELRKQRRRERAWY